MEENTTGYVKRTNSLLNLVLAIMMILTTFFSTGFYFVNRINKVESRVELEGELRRRIECQIVEIH